MGDTEWDKLPVPKYNVSRTMTLSARASINSKLKKTCFRMNYMKYIVCYKHGDCTSVADLFL